MVTGGAQKRLVHGSTIKWLSFLLPVQDEIQWIALFFYPKEVPVLDVSSQLVRRRLTGICNDVIVVWRCYWANIRVRPKLSGEKIIPWLKAIMRFLWVAFKFFNKVWHCIQCLRAKPTSRRRGQNRARFWSVQPAFCPVVENRLEQLVDFVVQESSKASSGIHRPVQDYINGYANQTSFVELRSSCHDVVDQHNHQMPSPNFDSFWRIWEPILLPEHLMEEHVDLGVGENGILQGFNRWMETVPFVCRRRWKLNHGCFSVFFVFSWGALSLNRL